MVKVEERKPTVQLIRHLLKNKDLNHSHFTTRYTLSYYDHWLDESEADIAFALDSLEDYLRIQNIETQFVKLFIHLHDRFKIKYYDAKTNKLEEFPDISTYILSVLEGLRELCEFIYYIDIIDTLLVSSYDQTIILYHLSNANLAELKETISNNKLHLLD
jgi:hypothetical protein